MSGKKKPEDKESAGQPTKYKPEYCQIYIDFCKEGGLVEEFPGHLYELEKVFICKATIYNWTKQFPEFLDAKRTGDSLASAWFIKHFRAATKGERKNFPSSPFIFLAKNKFGWRDQLDLSTDPVGDAEKREKLNKILDDPEMAEKAAAIIRQLNGEKSDSED